MTTQPVSKFLIAILPPSEISQEISAVKNHMAETYQSKAALRSPPHLTLHMPFQWRDDKTDKILSALQSFCPTRQPFRLELDGFDAFPPRVIFVRVLESAGLRAFQHELTRHVRRTLQLDNALYKDEPFHPHITVAFRDLKKNTFPLAWEEFRSREFHASFTVSVCSLLKHDGHRWNPWKDFTIGQGAEEL